MDMYDAIGIGLICAAFVGCAWAWAWYKSFEGN